MASTLDLLKNIYLPFSLEEDEGEGKGEGRGDCCLREKIETTSKNEKVDRISELPDQVLHHILSLLDMKVVVQTMFLSKRWKDVWRFVLNLSFDHSSWVYTYIKNSKWEIVAHKKGFVRFVNGVLSRLEGLKIDRFCLRGGGCYCEDNLVDEWISTAISCDVEEIYLDLYTTLPQSLLILPNQVRVLHLVSIRLQGNVSNGEMVLNLPNLETLTIRGCDHNNFRVLSICCPQLQNLVLDNDSLCNVSSCMIKISTLNLNLFKCNGCMYQDYLLENISACVSANIAAYPRISVVHLLQVLQDLGNVETLELSHCWFQDNFKESRIMEKCGEDLAFDFKFCFLNINDFDGSENELMFFEILFRNARLLESVTIKTTTSSSVEGKKFRKFQKKLYALSKACKSLKIYFFIKNPGYVENPYLSF